MKPFLKYNYLDRSAAFILFGVLSLLSCSKSGNSSSNSAKLCADIAWSNTLGLSGTFTGETSSGKYTLVAVDLEANGNQSFVSLHRDPTTGHLLNDQPGVTYTYNQNTLVNIVTAISGGTFTFTFDSKGHLTQTDIETADQSSTVSKTITYTYDSNDDPVKIIGHGTITISTGTSTFDEDITADYLTDKPNFLPLVPEAAPYSGPFAYDPFISKHLINEWQIKVTSDTYPENDFTRQYTYTYDINGYVATMVNSGNSNNVFKFSYSGCN